MKIGFIRTIMFSLAASAALATSAVYAQTPPKMATPIPPDITTPNTVETSLGTLKFFDGLPDKETVAKVYDNLDLIRGVDVFLKQGHILVASRDVHLAVTITPRRIGPSYCDHHVLGYGNAPCTARDSRRIA